MTEAEEQPRIWLGDEGELGIPDLTAEGWERLESPDYAVILPQGWGAVVCDPGAGGG